MPIAALFSRRSAILLILTLSGSLAAQADDASHRAKAVELMSILHTQRIVQNADDSLKKQVSEAAEKVAGPTPTEASKTKVVAFKTKADQMIDTQISWETLQGGFTDIYEKNFTEQQLDGILAFYKSPSGQAMLQHMPDVSTQVAQYGNSQMTALQPQLKQLFEDFQKSEAGTAAGAPAGKSSPASSGPASPGK